MNDSMLYRRFMLVAAMIAVMGAVTANVIQQTRSSGGAQHQNAIGERQQICISPSLCGIVGRYLPIA